MLITNVNKTLLFIFVLLSGCAYAENPMGETKTVALQVHPKSISAGENFRLTFPQLHPRKLSIRTPSGGWYSIHDSDEGVFILPLKKYIKSTELKLNPLILQGITWVNGKKIKEKVFQKQGEYLVYMANNLETEPENTFHLMTIIKFIK